MPAGSLTVANADQAPYNGAYAYQGTNTHTNDYWELDSGHYLVDDALNSCYVFATTSNVSAGGATGGTLSDYQLDYGTDAGPVAAGAVLTGGGATYATSGKWYSRSLNVYINHGGSAPSGSPQAPTVTVSASPVTPTGVTATAEAGLQVTVNQSASQPGGTTFNVLDGATSGSESLVASGVSLPYTYAAAGPGTRYVKLQAVSGGTTTASSAEVSVFAYDQESGASNTVTVTPNVPAPNAVTGLTGVLADSGTAPNPTLSWTLPGSGTTITSIGIFRGTTPGGEGGTAYAALSASATSYVDTAAAYNTDYYYQVGTIDAGGTTLSGELHLKTDTAAPTNLVGVAGNGQAALTWTNSTGTLGVAVERSADGGTTWGTLTTLSSALGTYTDTTPANGTAYKYRVRDIN